MTPESNRGIRHSLQDSRRDGLTKFIEELMPILQSEGFTIEDLLHSLANWLSSKPHLEEVSGYLEKATESMSKVTRG